MDELAAVWHMLSREHDVLPFLQRILAPSELALQPLRTAMEEIVTAAPDARPIAAGTVPTWVHLNSPDGGATLVLYRARTDGALYVVAPARSAQPSADLLR